MAIFGLFGSDAGAVKTKSAAPERARTTPAPAPTAAPDREAADEISRKRRIHREQLFVLVRSAMVSVPLPFKSYKFKVMSVDASGLLFVVMIDLVGEVDGSAAALKAIEGLIVSTAATAQDFRVHGVYWRFDVPAKVVAEPAALQPTADNQSPEARSLAQAAPTGSVLEQIGLDEMLAFRQAQAKAKEQLAKNRAAGVATPPAPRAAPARPREEGPSSSPSPLSPTQFGDL
jgi:hypothetical protein